VVTGVSCATRDQAMKAAFSRPVSALPTGCSTPPGDTPGARPCVLALGRPCLETVPGGVSSPPISLLGRHFHRDTRHRHHSNAPRNVGSESSTTELQQRSRGERSGGRGDGHRRSRERARASEPRCGAVVVQGGSVLVCGLSGRCISRATARLGCRSAFEDRLEAGRRERAPMGETHASNAGTRKYRQVLSEAGRRSVTGFTACPRGQLR